MAPAEAGWGRFKVVAIALDWLMKATHCTLPCREAARTRYTHTRVRGRIDRQLAMEWSRGCARDSPHIRVICSNPPLSGLLFPPFV